MRLTICEAVLAGESNAPHLCDMELAAKVQLLKDEYLLLQRLYEDFDSRALTIKGWGATVALAAIGVGFYQSHYLWLFAALSSVVFASIEALWKTFQYAHGRRIELLEAAFRDDKFDAVAPFQIYSSWEGAWSRRELRGQLIHSALELPHVVTLVVGLSLFALQHFLKLALAPK